MEKEKTAIIMAGGASRSAHGGGFLYALATQLGITSPDIMIGSSGDSGNVFYFSAGQYESMRHIFCELISTKKFIFPLRFWRVMDVDYLVDTIFREQEPLAVDKVLASPIRWLIPMTDFDTGVSRYVSAADHIDLFDILCATEAAPVFYGKKIPIEGRRYIDGEFGPTMEDHVQQALAHGATRLLIIDHTNQWRSPIVRLVASAYGLMTSHETRRALMKDIHAGAAHISLPQAKILAVSPVNLPIRSIANNRTKLRATFDRGISDALALESELRTLFDV